MHVLLKVIIGISFSLATYIRGYSPGWPLKGAKRAAHNLPITGVSAKIRFSKINGDEKVIAER
jgi:hypothetical protein